MKTFNLPDLGEGLPDAEINEWHIKEGDIVEADQLLVSMETAKAVVEVPAPRSGKVVKFYGKTGDIIKTHMPLIEFEDDDGSQAMEAHHEGKTAATTAATPMAISSNAVFLLPDLGEGLPDAEINEWHVKEGDEIEADQPLASMETAKAVVEVPSPHSGKIAKLYGKAGDVIITGSPLVEFVVTGGAPVAEDAGTVVGNIEVSNEVLRESATGIKPMKVSGNKIKAVPAARILAKKSGIDLSTVTGSGPHGSISVDDVKKHLGQGGAAVNIPVASPVATRPSIPGAEPLRGVRRTMAIMMSQSHREVVPVTILDDADIYAWPKGTDITLRIIRAVVFACKEEPALNAWYDGAANARKLFDEVNLGLAVDSKEGLFVPVINDVANLDAKEIRATVNRFKTQVQDRTIPQEELRGNTITLSNFGVFAGRYANPIIVPPSVAILGCGRLREEVVPEKGKPAIHRVMPLSITFDHRAATGGEATRFLAAVITDLQKEN